MSNWQIGQTVQAGFMNVVVKAELLDSIYIVANQAGTQLYKFIPHNGVHKITVEGAKDLLESDQRRKNAIMARVAEVQAQRASVNAVFA